MPRQYDPTPVTCECGATVTRGGLIQHRQSKKHQNGIALAIGAGPLLAFEQEDRPEPDEIPQDRAPRNSGPAKVTAIGGRGNAKQALLDEAAELTSWVQQDFIRTIEPAAPVVAEYWSQAEPDTTEAWTVICRNHPKALEKTLRAADWRAYYVLSKFGAGLLVALGVETGFMAADNGLAMATGVTSAWEKVMADRDELGQEVAQHYQAGMTNADNEDRWVGPLAGIG